MFRKGVTGDIGPRTIIRWTEGLVTGDALAWNIQHSMLVRWGFSDSPGQKEEQGPRSQ